MMNLSGKTVFISGGSRGIGRAIALRCAADGANIVIAAKTAEQHPTLPGTIHSVAEEIKQAGGQALALQVDIRDDEQIQSAMQQTEAKFGGLDILVNNASAISLTPTLQTSLKRFDLMFAVNVRGTFACSQAAIPLLEQSSHAHILNLAPPLNLNEKWFKDHVAYTMSKYGMSMCTLGMSAELADKGIAVNSLWPKTTIATAAIEVNFPKSILAASRKPEIMADAAYVVFCHDPRQLTGQFLIDETVLREQGVEDFEKYALNPGVPAFTDLFLDSEES